MIRNFASQLAGRELSVSWVDQGVAATKDEYTTDALSAEPAQRVGNRYSQRHKYGHLTKITAKGFFNRFQHYVNAINRKFEKVDLLYMQQLLISSTL
jgi:hypothetical protein